MAAKVNTVMVAKDHPWTCVDDWRPKGTVFLSARRYVIYGEVMYASIRAFGTQAKVDKDVAETPNPPLFEALELLIR